MGFDQPKPFVVYEDNQSTIAFALFRIIHPRMKHVDVKLYYVREAVKDGVVDVRYCPTSEMVADIITKGLTKQTFEKMRKCLGVAQIIK